VWLLVVIGPVLPVLHCLAACAVWLLVVIGLVLPVLHRLDACAVPLLPAGRLNRTPDGAETRQTGRTPPELPTPFAAAAAAAAAAAVAADVELDALGQTLQFQHGIQ